MDRTAYDKREFRRLPREFCVVEYLFGPVVDPCHGLIHRHHLDDLDPDSRTVPVCQRHHPQLQAALRRLRSPETAWKTCPHQHRTPEAREACERRLNRDLVEAA